MLQFLGHLHPVLVHLPIGILLLACLFLWQSRKDRHVNLQPSINVILLLGMISAIAACVTGYILSQTGDYDTDTVNLHQWMGISVAFVSIITYFFYKKRSLRKWQLPLAFVLVILIFITGHLGGSLTHGSDYLTQPLEDLLSDDSLTAFKRKPIPDVQEAFVYGDVIAPIFQEKCYTCHGKSKQKGKLRLEDSVSILKGGKDGVVIIPNKSAESELVKRIMLPREDEHHMAPNEKPQVSDNEITLLKWWIDNGASFSKKVKQLQQPEKIKSALLSLQNASREKEVDLDVPQTPVEKADESAIQKLKDSGVVVIPVSQNSNYLSVNFVTANINDKSISLLLLLKKQLVWLQLNNKPINDSVLSTLAECTNLTKVELAHTNITDKGLSFLKDLKQLRILNLVGTKITTSGLMQLKDLKNLQSLFLFQTNINKDDWAEIKKVFPRTSIDSGGYIVPLLPEDTIIVKPPPVKN
ncbi:MAG TPA: c-type cytochrome domain-containing protein [Puia sp.]|nr:c-type cytochrome domain-containing protein [Puia sp.]